MSAIVERIRERHGDEVAASVEAAIQEEWFRELEPIIESLREALNAMSRGFQVSDILQAQQLRESYERINVHLKDRKKLLINYRSRPSAIIVDPVAFEDTLERIEASLALLQRKIVGGTPRTLPNLKSAWDALEVPKEEE